jgi:hypothetical protein
VVFFVDAAHFDHGTFLGYPWCFTRLLIRDPSGRKRFKVSRTAGLFPPSRSPVVAPKSSLL